MLERRLVKVAVSFDLLLQWLTKGYELFGVTRTVKGVPNDALFVGSLFDDRRMEAYLVFSHPSFSVVDPGYDIPIMNVEIQRYHDAEADRLYRELIKKVEEENDRMVEA